LPCFPECRNARRIAADLAFGGGVLLARGIGHLLRSTPSRARLDLGCGCCADGSFGGDYDAVLIVHFAARGPKLAFDRFEASAFGEPARRAGESMRGDGKTIPAPKIAFSRYQSLARLERCRKAGAVAAFDDADLGQTAGKFQRALHKTRQRGGAFGQGWIGRIERRAGPAHRRGLIHRRVEIVAEGGAQRLLVALGDGQRVHHRRPQIFALDCQQLADGLCFGFKPLHAALGLSKRRSCRVDFVSCTRVRNLRGTCSTLSVRKSGLCGRKGLVQSGEVGLSAARCRKTGVDVGKFGFQAGGALFVIAQSHLKLIAAGGQIGKRAGQFSKRLFRCRQHCISLGNAAIDPGQSCGARRRFGSERCFLGG